jgi:hypothetical protein
MKEKRLPTNEYAIEPLLVLLILILLIAPIVFLGVRYEIKTRAESRAQAKQEQSMRQPCAPAVKYSRPA